MFVQRVIILTKLLLSCSLSEKQYVRL